VNIVHIILVISSVLLQIFSFSSYAENPPIDYGRDPVIPIKYFLNKLDFHLTIEKDDYFSFQSFNTNVKFSGEIRPISKKQTDIIAKFVKIIKKQEPEKYADLYANEILVSDGKHQYWLPIQQDNLMELKKYISNGQEFSLFLRYLGLSYESNNVFEPNCIINECKITHMPIMLIVGFDEIPISQPKTIKKCIKFSINNLNIHSKVKDFFQLWCNQKLKISIDKNLGSCVYFVIMNKKYNTYLAIFDAGPVESNTISAIQVSGDPNPELNLYKGLHLGDSEEKVKALLGEPSKIYEVTDNYIHWDFDNALYSVEFKEKKLKSFRIYNEF